MPVNLENISEHCRLCQVNLGIVIFTDNNEFISQVYDCTKVKIDDDDTKVFPKSVCYSCKLYVEEFSLFVQKIRLVDKQLRDHFLLSNCKDLEANKLQCNKCPALLSNETLLKEHIKTHTRSKRYQCPGCTKTYARYVNLQLHKRGHPSLFCFKCEFTFNDVVARKKHVCNCPTLKDGIKQDDNDTDGLVKSNCTVKNADSGPNELKDHLIGEEQMKKETTDEWYEGGFSVKQEEDSRQKGQDCDLACSKENEYFSESKHDKQFNIANEKKLNKGKGNYACHLCDKVCTSAYTLRTHLMKHEGKMPFLCVTCGKGFTTKNSLTCHEKIHAKVKAYNCKECDIGFSVASNLRAHQKKHHEGVRFYCSQCTRAFITKCSLERHELVHAGVKEFKCESCPAAFYTNKELLKHQRYHQGIRLYKCDECFKTFFEKHHLTIHIRVHTGERPYACKVAGCGKSFAESQKLSRHVKARHPSV